ncbi:hypothetical protein [Actinomadura madurae]|uniref:hypothetical protein n=2 Tax=Actinomadura madurae TaxID=1993 RepID=UPI0020D242FE|nr:hypothetical protein [Actinomadura madurae]MCP9955916.1 hypothetical protein [Actinomadura madurae]MCP9955965.1 hypothetical protein [Actinomadura madurae]MCP9985161.1 hypothetical protein [Actinomadura madurae]
MTTEPSGSASRPCSNETARPPRAMVCHSWSDSAVGPGANARNPDGSTPSSPMRRPPTCARAASTTVTPATPSSRLARSTAWGGKEDGPATSRCGVYRRVSGATVGVRGAWSTETRFPALAARRPPGRAR